MAPDLEKGRISYHRIILGCSSLGPFPFPVYNIEKLGMGLHLNIRLIMITQSTII